MGEGGRWGFMERFGFFVCDLLVFYRNYCELEYIFWNLIEDKRLVVDASWMFKLYVIVI